VLGPIEVVRDGQSLALGSTKQRALLAIFLLNANELLSRDRLIEELGASELRGAPGTRSRPTSIVSVRS
jgi:DNA-binding response OmpR family regulator